MKKNLLGFAGAVLLVAAAQPAFAGIYADDLTRCVVSATTAQDRAAFTRWMFATMSANPAVAEMSAVTDAQRDALTQEAALLIQRLLLDDCRRQTADAIKYERETAVAAAFETVGKVAMGDLMQDPAVAAQLAGLNRHLDQTRWTSFMEEVGRAPQ